jgi:hypothetical protein
MTYCIIGLSLDILGVILLYKYGILPNNLWKHILMDNRMSEKDEKKHKSFSRIALLILIIGFIFQILGVTLQNTEIKAEGIELKNLDLGTDYNESTQTTGKLKVKFNEDLLYYQLEIFGKSSTIDSIQKFTIELEDKDGFKISEIEISITPDKNEFSSLVKGDSIYLSANSFKYFTLKNYLQINKWNLLALKK